MMVKALSSSEYDMIDTILPYLRVWSSLSNARQSGLANRADILKELGYLQQ